MKTNNQARIVLKKTAVSGNMLLRIVGVLSLLAAAPSLLPPDTAKANDDGGWVVLWDADNDGMEPEKMAQASKADKKSKQYKHCAEKPLGSGGEWTYYGDGDKCQVDSAHQKRDFFVGQEWARGEKGCVFLFQVAGGSWGTGRGAGGGAFQV